ncbi:MAG: hypothetical protein AUJ21_00360 [Anaerolineae bacterium CG1_02_58_13]|nr:MAG: hypothetical protein AUJ21_00360 [Anaerolineae bacterium CG1_02_58_13]
MRTKSMIVSIILLAAVALSACAPSGIAANPAAPQRTLNVNGAGQVSLTPDIAYIYVGVHTENASASDAMTENNSRTQVMIDALKKAGIDEKDIRTTNFSIWRQDKYDPLTGQPSGVKVYSVDNTVYVTVRKLDSLGSLLDTLVKAGANNINSIQFDVADKTAAIKQARDAAVQDAKTQAQELAAVAGVTLGEITSVSFYEATSSPVMDGFGKGGGGGAEAAAVPIQPGQMTLTVTVSMTYEIK